MGTQNGLGFRILRNNLVILVDQTLVENRFQRPPDRLDVIVRTGDVGIVHIHPVAHLLGQLSPSLTVVFDMMIDQLLCFRVELSGAVLFHLGLVFQAEFFFNRNFHRQAVRIPPGFARHAVALHCLEAANNILDRPAENMMHSRLAVDCRRTFVKRKNLLSRFGKAFSENIMLFPEL